MRALIITHSITRRDEKSLEKYLSDISKYDVLTPDQELAIFKRIKSGDESALELIVRHNLRFVVSVAKQYQNAGLWLGDLISEGNLGLIKAAQRFDETRGFKFISYAVWWIRQSIIQAINDKGRKIRLPANQQAISRKINHSRIEFLQKKEREPTAAELAAATELSEAVVQKNISMYKRCSSLDAPLSEDSDSSMGSLMVDTNIESPDYDLQIKETQQKEVKFLLNKLTEREATVLSLYYGIERKHAMTLGDISEMVGTSRERIRQIRDKGLRKLRSKCQDMDMQLTI